MKHTNIKTKSSIMFSPKAYCWIPLPHVYTIDALLYPVYSLRTCTLHNGALIKAVLQGTYKHMTTHSTYDPHKKLRFCMHKCTLWLYLVSVTHYSSTTCTKWKIQTTYMHLLGPCLWTDQEIFSPSLLQDTMGRGYPVATHSKMAVWWTVRVRFSGPTRIMGSL